MKQFSWLPVLALLAAARSSDASDPAAGVPVLVELFTSEGCSSCPPADSLLLHLDQAQPVQGASVLVLSEHVDYWNRLGWRDPFSSAAFSERQQRYAARFGLESAYTPQMVVDGRAQFVGSDHRAARSAIAAAARIPKRKVKLEYAPASFNLRVEVEPSAKHDPVEVQVAITEDGLASHVSKGENAGKRLKHSAVVRKLIHAGSVDGGHAVPAAFDVRLPVPKEWDASRLRAVVFLQDRRTLAVSGSAVISLSR